MKYSLPSRLMRRQRGQALISILVFIAIGAIILTPVLNYIGTSLIVGEVFQEKTDDYYSADAGIVDAQWQIKNDRLSIVFPSPNYYNQYNFGTPTWGATVEGKKGWYYPSDVGNYNGSHKAEINDRNVAVRIMNLWAPSNITVPSAATAQSIAENYKLIVTGNDTGQLDTSGDSSGRKYEISITYYPEAGENLTIRTIGIWLPPGFIDYSDTSNVIQVNGSNYASSASRSESPNAGGTAILWTLNRICLVWVITIIR
ncbi:hypothetical protein DGWBC_1503 [Dehalogenimonas sp. WBC-2]|nr:hypothetical protein DGWBC_1503 [Dehalogenimonas sp. WBC-2]